MRPLSGVFWKGLLGALALIGPTLPPPSAKFETGLGLGVQLCVLGDRGLSVADREPGAEVLGVQVS